jgi:SAM-dependent methyltransferase/uncharacterized protein YbaR (Trm112 family)
LKNAPSAATGMRRSLLSSLHCPYCGSNLELIGGDEDAEIVDYGIFRCACHTYPIVEGIPILQQTAGLERVVEHVERREPKRALLQALKVFRVQWALQGKWHKLRYRLNCQRVVSKASMKFEGAAQLLRKPKEFADYLVHRYANPNFFAAIGAMMILKGLEGNPDEPWDAEPNATRNGVPRVLDLACGAGHTSFLLKLLYPRLTVISADHDFVSIYLAKRFLASNAAHVCWDAEVPSPFPDDYFDGVFCLDAFHYFHSKKAIVSELKRTVKSAGYWAFPHLHNRLQHNFVAGVPLAPEDYLECFELSEARLFSEDEILRGLSERGIVDLKREPELSELNQSQSLTLIGGGGDTWRVYDGFAAAFCREKPKLAVNPIYRKRWRQNGLELELVWPNDLMRNECRGAEEVVPLRTRLSTAELRNLSQESATPGWDRLPELVRSFVLVPLPRGYVNCDASEPPVVGHRGHHFRRWLKCTSQQ